MRTGLYQNLWSGKGEIRGLRVDYLVEQLSFFTTEHTESTENYPFFLCELRDLCGDFF
jgi:hypothetical protein